MRCDQNFNFYIKHHTVSLSVEKDKELKFFCFSYLHLHFHLYLYYNQSTIYWIVCHFFFEGHLNHPNKQFSMFFLRCSLRPLLHLSICLLFALTLSFSVSPFPSFSSSVSCSLFFIALSHYLPLSLFMSLSISLSQFSSLSLL